jgi:hypothetical protein
VERIGRRPASPPLAQAFVVCREIFEDCRTHEFMLIGPFSALTAAGFPLAARLSVYAHLTCGHGSYEVALQLRDAEEEAIWEWTCPAPIELANPLDQHRLTLRDAILGFPKPGRYDLLLLADGQELARHALHARGGPGPE